MCKPRRGSIPLQERYVKTLPGRGGSVAGPPRPTGKPGGWGMEAGSIATARKICKKPYLGVVAVMLDRQGQLASQVAEARRQDQLYC